MRSQQIVRHMQAPARIPHACGMEHTHLCSSCGRHEYTCCKPECAGLVQFGACPSCWPKRMKASALVGSVALSLLLALGLSANADDATPTPAAPSVRISSSAGTESLFRRDQPRKFVLFARLQVDAPIITCRPCTEPALHLFARADKSALSDVRRDVLSAASAQFDTFEVYLGAYRHVFGDVSIAALYGYSFPLQEPNPAGAPRTYPQTYGGGLFLGDPASGRWLLLAVGAHDSAGAGLQVLFATQFPIDGRLTAVADGALGRHGGFVRFGVAVAVLR